VTAVCPRKFEVEALRDGRLSGSERAHFERHLATCATCGNEARAFAALAEALRLPAPESDELRIRRERTRLLAAFVGSEPERRPRRAWVWLGAAALVALAVAAGFVSVMPKSASMPAQRAKAPDPVLVRADSSARWSRHAEGQLDKIVLESGALSIRVDHAASPRRVLVILPDGELEDIGTTFSVSADAGRTTRVTVQEGSVVLRLRDEPPIALGAGDAWSPPPPPRPSAVSPRPAVASPASPAKPPPAAPPLASADIRGSDPAAEFRAAMAAFNGGDNATAARSFAAFSSQHPRDSRAEDAAYLRVLALQRGGMAAATHAAALEYLRRYPGGFRRAEVERLSR